MINKDGKTDFHLWIYPETLELIKKYKDEEGLKTQSMFVERAIRFYCGYLASEKRNEYLPTVINDLFVAYIGDLEDKICCMVFKNTVELGTLLHVYSALNNVTEENLKEVHDAVIKEIKSTYGIVSFKKILEFQNSQKDL